MMTAVMNMISSQHMKTLHGGSFLMPRARDADRDLGLCAEVDGRDDAVRSADDRGHEHDLACAYESAPARAASGCCEAALAGDAEADGVNPGSDRERNGVIWHGE